MKKALMGTTALVAAAVTTGVAVAEEMMAEPLSLSIGGRSHWGVAIFDDEAAGERDDAQISNDALLTFAGSTVLDNGVEVSILIEIEGEQSGDQGDAKFAELSGSFGAIRVANDSVAAQKMATLAPYATYFYGINDAYWSFSYSSAFDGATSGQTWMDTYANAGVGASANLTYFSPVINGFQFGATYVPEAGSEARSATAGVGKGNDAFSVGLRYDGAFGDTGIAASFGYTNHDGATVSTTEFGGGLVVSMMGVSIGGSMSVQDDESNDDLTQMDLGISYGEGAWTVSANVGNATDDDANIDTDFARLLANYNLGPGVNVAGALGNDSPITGNDTSFAGIALGISF